MKNWFTVNVEKMPWYEKRGKKCFRIIQISIKKAVSCISV